MAGSLRASRVMYYFHHAQLAGYISPSPLTRMNGYHAFFAVHISLAVASHHQLIINKYKSVLDAPSRG
jgi:hypothetical protein